MRWMLPRSADGDARPGGAVRAARLAGLVVAALLLVLPAERARAQQADGSIETEPAAGRLLLELNHLEAVAPADAEGELCRVSLVVENTLGAEIADLRIELALFGPAGRVDGMLVLDLGRLPAGKTRVRQYDLEAPGCAFSRILVNQVIACEGPGLDPRSCADALVVTDRTDVPFVL